MVSAMIAALSVAVLHFGMRWLEARSEAAALRTQVAFLKRRLTQTRL